MLSVKVAELKSTTHAGKRIDVGCPASSIFKMIYKDTPAETRELSIAELARMEEDEAAN
jgi:hypothetical protein